ncbi:NADH dehydrogenase [ubiquinone] 1 alpha subcomplex subunit [Fasciola gigantica]|uniref:NADH dehydrogenase [ubiquinone] 1 alpha subcomplex subunit n=1 Tax=Fasciola gigantica TaxID=46835 RepID=A0A504Z0T7_FASGI|nr:NADH dehydrogenase [ubiquinone] 1 alpha subcomplex subunit [Fasciola gigantica]
MVCVNPGVLLCLRCRPKMFRGFVRTLKLIETGDVTFKKPPPFDYMTKHFSIIKSMIDPTYARLNENTKVIAVEGNIASGKSQLASKLAGYFGMVHYPDPTEDDIYRINCCPPFDLRVHNALLPDSAKYYTTEMFWNEPDLINKGKPLYLQYQYYIQRYWNYLKALCNLFNTGHGFIVDRSPFSEIAFSEALYKCGYMSEIAHRWFNQHHGVTVKHLWKPHLLIYVKATKEQIRERLKKRNIVRHRPWELNACNLTDKFLDAYTVALEKAYLSRMSRYSEILVVDGSTTDVHDDDDVRIIAQKMTEINLVGDHLLRDDYKLIEWRTGLFNDRAKINARARFSDADRSFTKYFRNVKMPIDMQEGCYSFDDHEMQIAVLRMDPRTRYPPSSNPRYTGILNIMFNPFLTKRNFARDLPKDYLWL